MMQQVKNALRNEAVEEKRNRAEAVAKKAKKRAKRAYQDWDLHDMEASKKLAIRRQMANPAVKSQRATANGKELQKQPPKKLTQTVQEGSGEQKSSQKQKPLKSSKELPKALPSNVSEGAAIKKEASKQDHLLGFGNHTSVHGNQTKTARRGNATSTALRLPDKPRALAPRSTKL